MPLTKEVQLWVPRHHRRVKRRLQNWGNWAGGDVQDPALVYYYTKQPWHIDKDEKGTPPIDKLDAERTERVLLKLRNSSKIGAYWFRLLRARYAYGRLVREIAQARRLTISAAYNALYTAEFEFAQVWKERFYGRSQPTQQQLDV